MRDHSHCFFHLMTIFLLTLLISGCGRKVAPERFVIQGEITLDHEPLKSGRILFTPSDNTNGPAAVTTIKDGVYSFNRTNGPVGGKHKVQIESLPTPGFELDDEAAYAQAIREGRGKPVLPAEVISPEFNTNSKLEAVIVRNGQCHFDYDLKSAIVAQRR